MCDQASMDFPTELSVFTPETQRKRNAKVVINDQCTKDAIYTDEQIRVPRLFVEFVHGIWKAGKLCDLTVITRDGEIPVHKLVLAAYSEKLMAVYSAEKPSNARSVFDLSKFSGDAVTRVLEFCYTADINLNDENISDITTISKQLGIKYLTEVCIHYLSQFKVENALFYHSICTNLKLAALAFRIWEFICENVEAVSKTEEFKMESIHTVTSLLREDQLKVSSELVVLDAAIRWLEADPGRHSHSNEIASCIRLPLIKAEDIVKRTPNCSFLLNNPAGAELMYRAMCYHALTVNHSILADHYAAAPRTGPVKSVFHSFDVSQLL